MAAVAELLKLLVALALKLAEVSIEGRNDEDVCRSRLRRHTPLISSAIIVLFPAMASMLTTVLALIELIVSCNRASCSGGSKKASPSFERTMAFS